MINKENAIILDEQQRIYRFPNNEIVTIDKVVELIVSDSGNHRIKTAEGDLHIVPKGWVHLKIITSKDWTV